MAERFTVRFYMNTPNRPKNDFGFFDDGVVEVGPDAVTISGKVHRSFRFARQHAQRMELQDVWNAWSDRDEIIFDCRDGNKLRTVGFTVSSPNDSRRIMELLPMQQTKDYAVRQTEREVFYDRIQHWSPGAPVMWTLLAVNVVIFGLMWLAGVYKNPSTTALALVKWGSNFGLLTARGQWWRLVSSMFLHGGALHILFNMVALVQIGGLVERLFGSSRFIALYLLAGVCGSLASLWWTHGMGNSVGASGAIFGLMGGLLAFLRNPHSGVPATVVKDLRGSATGFILFNIFAGFVYPHTDNAAHIGGLVGGYLAGLLLARSLHVPGARA